MNPSIILRYDKTVSLPDCEVKEWVDNLFRWALVTNTTTVSSFSDLLVLKVICAKVLELSFSPDDIKFQDSDGNLHRIFTDAHRLDLTAPCIKELYDGPLGVLDETLDKLLGLN